LVPKKKRKKKNLNDWMIEGQFCSSSHPAVQILLARNVSLKNPTVGFLKKKKLNLF